jgi:transposase InsO family protein
MRIAYLINQYPKVSHSFIRCEIQALERRGINVMRIALRGWDDVLVDPDDELERERTLDFYNRRRPHSSLDGSTPDQAYFTPLPLRSAA